MKVDKALIATILFIIAFASGFYLGQYIIKEKTNFKEISIREKVILATFYCDDNKTIAAEFGKRSVSLVLSDERKITLPQAISASGARYANEDESFVFWNKGDSAFIQEGENYTYINCLTK